MNILQLTYSYERGGRREAIKNLTNGLIELGHKVFLGCSDHLGCNESDVSQFHDYVVFSRRGKWRRHDALLLAQYCKQNNVQIIHTHDAASFSLAFQARVFGKNSIPFVMTFHRSLDFETANLSGKIRNALCLMYGAGVITVSEARGRDFLRQNLVKPKILRLINLSADVARFRFDPEQGTRTRNRLGLSDEDLVAGAIGHFGLEKGIDLVISGFHAAQAKFLESHPGKRLALIILGEGKEEDSKRLKGLVDSLGAQNVHFAGFHTDPEHWLPAFDIFMHGARQENGATVLFEAMACGIPIVGNDVGGIPEAIVDGVTGYIVDASNSQAFGEAALKLLNDSELRTKMGTDGLSRCLTNFTREHFVRKHVDFYKQILSEG